MTTRLKSGAFFFLTFIVLIGYSSFKTTNTNESVVEKMHAQWKGKWPKNMQFEQNVYFYENEKIVKEEVWQEILSCPQNLHIRFNGFQTGNGVIFRNDSVISFKNNQVVKKEKRVHQLLLLGFDVYHQEPGLTEKKLKELGFELDKSYQTKNEDREIIVVGTNEMNDTNSSQFWIDKQNMYLLRVILNKDSTQSDIRFGNYKVIEGYPVATEITFVVNKKLVMVEKYFNIKFPKDIDPEIFNPKNFKDVVW